MPEQVPPPQWDKPNDAIPAIANFRVPPLAWVQPQRAVLHRPLHLISHLRGIHHTVPLRTFMLGLLPHPSGIPLPWVVPCVAGRRHPTYVGPTGHGYVLTCILTGSPTCVGINPLSPAPGSRSTEIPTHVGST